jgi:hypothetical protein
MDGRAIDKVLAERLPPEEAEGDSGDEPTPGN